MSEQDRTVLCCANSYEQKYYLNPMFERLPGEVKAELKIMCVLFTEDIGGVMLLAFDRAGNLKIQVEAADADVLFDEIGCGLKVREIQQTKRELFHGLELYYKVLNGYEDVSWKEG